MVSYGIPSACCGPWASPATDELSQARSHPMPPHDSGAKWLAARQSHCNTDLHASLPGAIGRRQGVLPQRYGRRLRRAVRSQRGLPGCRWPVPHLLELGSRQGRGDRRLDLFGDHAQRRQRARNLGLGQAARPVRGGRSLPFGAKAGTWRGNCHELKALARCLADTR